MDEQALVRHCPAGSVRTIVDVGCGTGRFTTSLADHFAATIYGIDPSRKMLSVARESLAHPDVILVQGSAEHLPLADALADLIFLSMVYHHIQDKPLAGCEFRRILKPDGSLCFRTVSRERLIACPWLSFFPEALAIDSERIASAEELVKEMDKAGFSLRAHDVFQQQFARSFEEYAEKIGQRSISSLKAISDETFECGLAALRAYCRKQPASPAYEDIELFVFNPGRD